MATTPVEFDLGIAGLTVTATVYPLKNDTAVASGKTCTAQTNRTTTYRFDVTEVVTGVNDVRVYESGVEIGRFITESMLDDTTVYKAFDANANVVSVGTAAVTAIQSGLATSTAQTTAQNDLDLLTGADGATLATLQGNYAPSKAGDQMALVNDAITAGKYDETTAFPLTAVNGSTLTEAGGTGDQFTAVPWNAAWDAEVQSEVADALTVYDPPTRAELTSDINSILAALPVMASGTIGATGNDTTHLHLDGLTFPNDALNDTLIVITDVSTGLEHSEWISDWVLSTELATMDAALPFTPQDSTDTYIIYAIRRDVTSSGGASPDIELSITHVRTSS